MFAQYPWSHRKLLLQPQDGRTIPRNRLELEGAEEGDLILRIDLVVSEIDQKLSEHTCL